ncbi:hypothetical protein K435DRAFT_779013 [Dendrothele bispora CBS 962.96]|uniref:Uncharacterized protein n=1 Tax=Dendrothele bispora (strain CBS 962.96) TaxID=1314807 RepID=A0A4S8M0C3_DENBC|nr:hypothetical protein K435DRAFT_779013 [Dendrothele bispora CBS 962.96]
MSLLYRELQGTGADSDDVLSSTTSQNHPDIILPDALFANDYASEPPNSTSFPFSQQPEVCATHGDVPSSTTSQNHHISLPDSLFANDYASEPPNSTSFSFPQQPEVSATQATFAVGLKNKYNLQGQYAADFDSFVKASDQERVLMSAAWTQVILMNSESKHEGISEPLKKAARVYVLYTLLSPNLASYSGKIPGAVIDAMRCCGIEDVPDDSQPDKLTKLTTYISSQVSGGKNNLKTKVNESLKDFSNIADLAKAVIGKQSIPLTKELCVRLAFLRWVTATIQSQPGHLANKDGTKWWEEVDKYLSDARKGGNAWERDYFRRVYAEDIKRYGDPELSGLKPVAPTRLQMAVDRFAMAVKAR